MANLQEQVNDICRLADAVIKNPGQSIKTTALSIGVGVAIANFALGGFMVFNPIVFPVGYTLYKIYKAFKGKGIERQEKERMLREVIRKQQAVIRKLEEELRKSRIQSAKNRQEIENLRSILEMLEKTEEHIKAA